MRAGSTHTASASGIGRSVLLTNVFMGVAVRGRANTEKDTLGVPAFNRIWCAGQHQVALGNGDEAVALAAEPRLGLPELPTLASSQRGYLKRLVGVSGETSTDLGAPSTGFHGDTPSEPFTRGVCARDPWRSAYVTSRRGTVRNGNIQRSRTRPVMR